MVQEKHRCITCQYYVRYKEPLINWILFGGRRIMPMCSYERDGIKTVDYVLGTPAPINLTDCYVRNSDGLCSYWLFNPNAPGYRSGDED